MKEFFKLPVLPRIILPALLSLGSSILIGAGWLLAQQAQIKPPQLESELAPAAFAAPTQAIERLDAPDDRLSEERQEALTAALDRYHARTGLSVYVVFGDEAAQRAADDLKLEFQTGNTLLLTVLSGDVPGLIFSGPLRDKLDVENVKRRATRLWQDQKEAEFSPQQQVLNVADLVVEAVNAPLPGAAPGSQEAEAPVAAAAGTPAQARAASNAPGTAPVTNQANAAPGTEAIEGEASQGGEIGRKALNLAIISIVFLLIAAGGAFALLNLYKPVQASPEASRRMAQKRQREEVRSRAERQRMREIEQEKRKEVNERRRKRVQRTMRDTQQLLEAAKKKLTDTVPAPNRLSGGAGERLDPSLIQGGRAAGETFEQWLWRSLKDFNRLHYGRMTDNLSPERAAALRRHGFFDALEELAAYFKWRTDEAAAEGKDQERKEYEERYGLTLNYAATLKRTAPNLRKHVMGGVESFLRECDEAGLIPKPGMGRPRKG